MSSREEPVYKSSGSFVVETWVLAIGEFIYQWCIRGLIIKGVSCAIDGCARQYKTISSTFCLLCSYSVRTLINFAS